MQAYQSRPDPLAGLSPRDLQDKELGALHQRLQANPADLDGWAALGQLYLYRDEYDNALLAYQRLALQEGGASAATQAAQATVLYYQAGQQLTPEALSLLDSALKQDKGEVSALMLLASDHFLHGRYSQAIALWQQLLDEERPRITGRTDRGHSDRADDGRMKRGKTAIMQRAIFPAGRRFIAMVAMNNLFIIPRRRKVQKESSSRPSPAYSAPPWWRVWHGLTGLYDSLYRAHSPDAGDFKVRQPIKWKYPATRRCEASITVI